MRLNLNNRIPKAGDRIILLTVLTAALLLTPAAAFAQGSIFGTVQNANLSTPADGDILFFGFLDDTDEEIRIESCDGAGYQSGNWFDDFQNYLTEAAGNQYDYYFVNTVNGQGFHLAKAIPNNSFQQENILLAAATIPTRPVNLSVRGISSTRMVVTWSGVSGLTYHVYRRLSTSNGSFFRVDNPAGSLANPGVADSFFVDTTVDGVSSYSYVVIAQDGSGNYSAHSAIATASSAVITAPVVASITPATGPTVGGTPVSIYGMGFDAAGLTLTIDGTTASGVTVVNTSRITATTPAGSGPANVVVTNTSSGLAGTLVNGFNYYANTAPVANAGPDQLGRFKNTLITLNGTGSSDINGDSLTYNWLQTSGPAVVLSSNSAAQPTFTANANGDYFFRLVVNDGITNSIPDTVRVQVVERAPVLATIGPRNVTEGANLNFLATANDPDGTTPVLSALNVPANATFVNNGNGTGTFNFNPTFLQAGVYNVTFIASDGILADSEAVAITVIEAGNQRPVLAAIGPRNVNEGAVLNFNTSATDADATIPTFSAVGLPANATYVDNLNGTASFSFSPNFTQAGVYNVTFIASDGTLADSEVVAITVNDSGNQRPVLATIGPRFVTEGANLNFNITATDADGTIPALTALNLPANATFNNNGNGTGTFNFTPGFTQSGLYNVTFIASDGTLADSEVVAITVNDAGNQRPVLAAIGPRFVNEGVNLNFLATATDPDATTPILSAVGLPSGATFINNGNGTGTFNFTPNFSQSGLYNVTFIASDGVLADSEVVAITVNDAGNQAPVLAAIGPRNTQEGQVLNFNTSATDPDGTTPSFSAVNLPANASYINNGNGTATFSFSPNFTQAGLYNVTFIASDGTLADSEVVAITVADGGNQRPVLATIGPRSITEGVNLSFVATAIDPDSTIPVLSAVNLPLNANFVNNGNGTGTFNFTPGFTQSGLYNVTFIASDGTLADSEVVAITVNDAGNQRPVLAAIGPRSVNEGVNLNFVASATDPDASIPILSAVNLPSGATFNNNGNGTGTFNFTPSFIQSGVYNVTFIASDGVLADSEVVAITVNDAGNQAPVLASIGPRNTQEGLVLNFNTSATDADGTIPTFSALNLPANSSYINNGNGTASFSFSPNFTQAGVYNVTFIASDGLLADSEVVAITVAESGNQRPVLATIGPRSVTEGINLNFVASATDPDLTTPSLTAVNLPLNATFLDNGNGTGSFSFTPDFTQSGLYNVTFIASDGTLADSEVVAITVNDAGNQRPVLAAIGPRSVNEGVNLNFLASATDPDASIPILSAVNLPSGATFINNGNGTGTFNFTPSFIQSGIYNVTFIASDGVLADSEVVSITVNEVGNQAPVLATIGPRNTQEGLLLNFNTSATDPDGTIPTFSAVNLPANSSYINNGNGTASFSFSPNFTQAGVYNVTFIASDGLLADSEVVAITVAESGNQRPVLATIGPRSVTEGVNLSFVATAIDPDSTIPVLSAVNLPLNATFVNNGNGTGSFSFTPGFTQSGLYNVTFIASDGTLADSEVVAITVNDAGNQRPVLAPIGPQLVNEGANLNFLANATDPDGTNPNFQAVGLPSGATFINNGNGTATFNFTPTFAQSGVYNVTFIATDGILADSEVVAITVNDAGNQAPVLAAIGPRVVNEGANLNFNVSASDLDGTIPVLTAEGVPANATFTNFGNGTGTFNFSPNFAQAGIYNVLFIASDGILSDSESVQITVSDANRAPVLTAIGAKNVNEGANLNFLATATDPDGTIPAISAVNLPANATFVDNGNGSGTFNFNPSFSQAGLYNVTFIASDGIQADSEIVPITVIDAGNQRPVLAAIGNKLVQEGDTLEFRVSAADPDGAIPVLTAFSIPANAAFVDSANGAGSFLFTPDFNQTGFYNVLFVASDGILADSEVVQITVGEAGNIPPVLDPIGPRQIAENNVLTILVHAIDEAGIPSLFVNTTMDNYAFVDSGNGFGVFTYTPNYFDAGLDAVTFFAIDDGGLVDQENVVITTIDVNRPPKITPIPDVIAVPGDSLKIHVVATDSTDANGGRLYLLALTKPTGSVFTDSTNNRGSLRWKPTINDTGTYQFIVLCSDDESPALSTRDTATITVVVANQAPVLANIGPKSVMEGQVLEFRFSAMDPDGTVPFFFAQNLPLNATIVDSANGAGSLRFSPAFNQSGLHSPKIYASDGNKSDNEVVLIQVINVPQPPVIAVPSGTQTVTEGEVLAFSISASDLDGTIPSLRIDSTLTPPINSVFVDSLNGRGSFRFSPVFVQAGLYDLTFIAFDGILADTGVVTVEVLDAGNQPPILTIKRGPTTINDQDTVFANETDIIILDLSTTDADSVAPVFSTTTLPFTSEITDHGDGTGVYFWDTDLLQNGIYNITFYATDGDDNQIVDSSRIVIKLRTFNVIPNTIQFLTNPGEFCGSSANCWTDTRFINEGSSITIRFYSSDPNGTPPQLVARLYTLIDPLGTPTTANLNILFAQALPANMNVTRVGDTATFIFNPNFQQAGTYRVAMLAIDADSATMFQVSPWIISVTNIPQPPTLSPIGPLSVMEGQTLDVNITGFDPDGLPVTITSSALPTGATLTALTGQPAGTATSRLLYTPGFATAGAYNVVFRCREVTPPLLDTEIVVITVIEAGPQSPQFVNLNSSYTVNANSEILRLYIRATDSDSPPPALSYSGVPIAPWNGVFVDSGSGRGSYTFDPIPNQADSIYNLRFIATSGDGRADTMFTSLEVILGVCGDADGNQIVSISDAVYVINFIFAGGPAPTSQRGGDPDGNCITSISDAVYLINFIFAGGAVPCANGGCQSP